MTFSHAQLHSSITHDQLPPVWIKLECKFGAGYNSHRSQMLRGDDFWEQEQEGGGDNDIKK